MSEENINKEDINKLKNLRDMSDIGFWIASIFVIVLTLINDGSSNYVLYFGLFIQITMAILWVVCNNMLDKIKNG